MNFLPRDICKKLVESGCKSESHYYWAQEHKGDQPHYKYVSWSKRDKLIKPVCDAFIFQDVCGISEQAMENARILWPDKEPTTIPCPANKPGCLVLHLTSGQTTYEKKHRMLEMTWDEWVEFMRKAVG